jgi:hypothetical protein
MLLHELAEVAEVASMSNYFSSIIASIRLTMWNADTLGPSIPECLMRLLAESWMKDAPISVSPWRIIS